MNKLTNAERLKDWQILQKGLTAAYGDLNALTGAMPDCPLLNPVFALWAAYTESISELVGDHEQWLEWYEYECKMGKNPKWVKISDGREFAVKSLKQLLMVIEDHG
jgi:hypothetical protein